MKNTKKKKGMVKQMKGWKMSEKIVLWMMMFAMVAAAAQLPAFVSEAKTTPQFEKEEIFTFCGSRLSEVPLPVVENGHFEWEDGNETVEKREGWIILRRAIFIPDDKEYGEEYLDVFKITPMHFFENGRHLTHVEAAEATENKEGNYEFYRCETCNKYFEADGTHEEKDAAYFVKPYVVKDVTVSLGTDVEFEELVKNGQESIVSMKLENEQAYKKYLTFDESTGTIETKEYYKQKLKNPTIVITDKAGSTYKVKVNVQIEAPTEEQVKITRKQLTLAGITGYRYEIKYNVKNAKNLTIKVSSGAFSKRGDKKMNALLKKRVTKSKGTAIFMIKKSDMKKNKITFNVVANYGKGNKSQVLSVSK